jgi:hypothetical protein
MACELGVHRETVARYVERAAQANAGGADDVGPSKPANAPFGSDDTIPGDSACGSANAKPTNAPAGSGDPKPTNAPAGSEVRVAMGVGPPSACAAFRAIIDAKVEKGLSAQRIYQDLTTEHGFSGSYYSVRRFVRRLQRTHSLPFRRMECAPGDEAQTTAKASRTKSRSRSVRVAAS